MKKIAFLLAAVAFMTAANAQVVVGIHGGYHWQKNSQSFNTDNYIQADNWLGGLQVGYMVTPKLYVGVSGNYQNFTADTFYLHSDIMFEGMPRTVDNRMLNMKQSGWTVSPQVKWEFLKYGNMHFHLLLQGGFGSLRGRFAFTVEQAVQPTLDSVRLCRLGGIVVHSGLRRLLPVVTHLTAHGETPVTRHVGKLYHIGFDQVQVVNDIIVGNGQVEGLISIEAHQQPCLVAIGMTLVKVVGDARAVEVPRQVGIHVVERHVAHLHTLAVGLEGIGDAFSPFGGMIEEHA